MGVLKDLTKEYFGEILRKEDDINIEGLDVEIVSFKDKNGKKHKRGYKPKSLYNLSQLLERMIEVRGDEGDFNDIDTSEIEDMSFLFLNNKTFNGDISGWDVSNVKIMKNMFSYAASFNQDISKWVVSKVTDMKNMFGDAASFNQDISNWDVSNVTDMKDMFNGAKSFNQDISKWKFPKVTDMEDMFFGAESFNQNLSEWDLTRINTKHIFTLCPIKDEFKPKMKKE